MDRQRQSHREREADKWMQGERNKETDKDGDR